MPEHSSVSYGVGGTRGNGAGSCGLFHEFLPGDDRMCACCRPSPNDPEIVRANGWLKKQGISTEYGSKAWGEGLLQWDKAGRP